MIRPGLCSVTFRALPVDQVVDLADRSGLRCIEWAGDAHVPPGDLAAAQNARTRTETAGLAVASYGSYLGFQGTEAEVVSAAEDVLDSAVALGAPRVRVWAGRTGSAEISDEVRAQTVARIQHFADAAATRGLAVGLEFHGGTLTDDIGSTLRLLDQIGRDNVATYWQPHQGQPEEHALDTLRQALPRTSTIHVFSWWPTHERHPLEARADLWSRVFTTLAAEGSDRDALLEFVPDDDPDVLAREAAALRTLIAEAAAH